MFNLQRWTGCVISALSAYVVISNSLYYKDLDSLISICLGGSSLVLFFISIFVDSIILRALQCVMFFVVSVYGVTSETDPILICIGFSFMFVGYELFLAYKFIERRPVSVVLCGLLGMVLFFLVVLHDLIMAAVATFGLGGVFSVLWLIRHHETMELRDAAREAVSIAHDAIDLVKKESQNG